MLSDDGAQLIGWVTHRDVLRAYAGRLSQSVTAAARQPASVVPTQSPVASDRHPEVIGLAGYRMLDLRLATPGPPVGQAVGAARWPPATVLVAIRRDDEWITVSEATVLREGDRLTVLVPAEQVDDLSDRLGSEAAGHGAVTRPDPGPGPR